MLHIKSKKMAEKIHEEAVKKYNAMYEQMQNSGEDLYAERVSAGHFVDRVEKLINSIANHPKEFDVELSRIRIEREKFHSTEQYAEDSLKSAVASAMGAATGVTVGTAVVSMVPNTAMWIATTFGTASTGTAISTLHGIAATKAALAWLGGGALSAGGSGIAGGQAFLALCGPIGWGIAGISTTVSVAMLGFRNKEIEKQAIEEAKKITIAGAELHEIDAKIKSILQKTQIMHQNLNETFERSCLLRGCDYSSLHEDQQLSLGTLVNNTSTLAQLLNEIVN